MSQMFLDFSASSKPVTVGELTRLVRTRLETDPDLQNVRVTGEVSNVSTPQSGHLYLTLKDAQASLRCVMWKPQVQRLRFTPRAGDLVEAQGGIGVYEAGGQYQLYMQSIQPAGQGALYQEFLRLKAALEDEGLFDPSRKRPVPTAPACIGIVTSPTGAALQDMLNTIRRRYPLAEVLIAPTAVQGIDAPPGIVRSLERLAADGRAEVILLGRGGGSLEDLWAFNDETVVRAIAACPIPVVTGIGHETDFTLADFASDLRAPTPTAAAELVTPDRLELQSALREIGEHLDRLAASLLFTLRQGCEAMDYRLERVAPTARLANERQRLDERSLRTARAAAARLDRTGLQLGSIRARLEAANPVGILQRGYSIVTGPDGAVIASVAQTTRGDRLNVRVHDGIYPVVVSKAAE
ncbi:MAG TPA: exodeoxyribonuclease VII large subunit [Anaerolineales bacterium]|nr:exodeoxyribonuclease VII large subunit [Anaerolineales bacterium]